MLTCGMVRTLPFSAGSMPQGGNARQEPQENPEAAARNPLRKPFGAKMFTKKLRHGIFLAPLHPFDEDANSVIHRDLADTRY